jgi:outer membrane receptor protein involved in Fe transport
MKARFGLWAILAIVIFLGSAGSATSQVTVAQLNGTVIDESGGSVAGASVSLREVDTNSLYTAVTNDTGFYAVPNLPPGRYELKISFKGFANYTQTGIVLTVGQSATINVSLKVAARGEQIVVSTETPEIEPTKTEISQVIDTQQIASLPISSRVFTDFALLTPGVASSRTSLGTTFTEFEVTQISFGGQRSFSNEITVDGADFVNSVSGVQRATPPQDSVQEFRVVNNSFGAEYGRALGGIVNIVTKSGGNDLHGSVYDYFQNSATDARSLLQPAPLPHELRQNQFGATLGGPVKKDKAFFFVNYEGQRSAQSPTYAPDLANNIDTIDLAKSYLGLSPEGCFKPLAACTGTPQGYLNGYLKTANHDFGFARFDDQISTNNRLAIRYLVEDVRNTGELVGQTLDGGGIGTPSGGRNLFVRDQSLVATLSSVLSPNVVNTALVQYARRHYNFPGATGEPDLSVSNDLEFGHNFGTYDAIYESRLEGGDSVSWVKGNHVIKFGADLNYVWSANNYPGFTPERLLFPNLNCVVDFANFVDFGGGAPVGQIPTPTQACPLAPQADGVGFMYWGTALPRANCPNLAPCANGFFNGYSPLPATGSGFGTGWPNAFPTNQYGNYQYTLNHGYFGFYAQDQWRLTPKLTVNYGLRWDFESGLGQVIEPDYRAWQPRIGFAYSPDSKTVIRSGFGIFFDRNNMTFFFTTGNQKALPGYFCNPPGADPSCAANGIAAVKVPMIRQGAGSAGWQLNAQPGFPGVPVPGGAPGSTASLAESILAGNPYPGVTLTGVCALGMFGPGGECGVGAGGIQRNGRLPYAEQASLEIDREIGKGFAINVGYLWVSAHKLVRGNNLNVPCPLGTDKPGNPYYAQGWLDPSGSLTPCQGTPTLGPLGLGPIFSTLANPAGLEFTTPAASGPSAGLPTIGAGLLDYNNNVANTAYNGLTVTAIERWGRYINLTANYTYSHTIDNGNFTTFINLPPNQFDYASERGNSNQDVRHRFVTNFTLTAPQHSFLRNFEFSSIVTLQAGRPFTLYAGNNVLGDLAGPNTDRVGGPPVVSSACITVTDCSTLIGRNTYVGDPLYAWDLRISRYFMITERMKLDLMFDAFNALNRPNVDEITTVYGSPAFCGTNPVIPSHYRDAASTAIQQGAVSCASQQIAAAPPNWLAIGAIPVSIPNAPNQTFGLPRTMLNPRLLQFSAKFSF